jgi:hypothetical protein
MNIHTMISNYFHPMKSNSVFKMILALLLAGLAVTARAGSSEKSSDAIDLVRSIYKSDRQAFLTEALQLTDAEGKVFWPLYQSYRADIDKIGDGLVKLVLEYGDLYPNVSEADAKRLLKQYLALEEKLVKKRAWYFKRAAKKIPADKALQWAQLENRMDLVLRLQLAGTIPVVPAGKGDGGKQ